MSFIFGSIEHLFKIAYLFIPIAAIYAGWIGDLTLALYIAIASWLSSVGVIISGILKLSFAFQERMGTWRLVAPGESIGISLKMLMFSLIFSFIAYLLGMAASAIAT